MVDPKKVSFEGLDAAIREEEKLFRSHVGRLQGHEDDDIISDLLPVSRLIDPYAVIITYLENTGFQHEDFDIRRLDLARQTIEIEESEANDGTTPVRLAMHYLAMGNYRGASRAARDYDAANMLEHFKQPKKGDVLVQNITELMEFIQDPDNAKLCSDILQRAAKAYDVSERIDSWDEFRADKHPIKEHEGRYAGRLFVLYNDRITAKDLLDNMQNGDTNIPGPEETN